MEIQARHEGQETGIGVIEHRSELPSEVKIMRGVRISIILMCLTQVTVLSAQRTRIGNSDSLPNAGMLPPQVISSTLPSYTSDALVNRIEGSVTVEAEADIYGSIKVLRIVKGLGHGLDET